MQSSDKTSLGLVFLLWFAGLTAAAQFAKIAVIFPTIQEIYPDAGPSLGFILSLISFLGIAFGLFAGLIVAQIGFRKLLLWALVLGAIISAAQSTFPSLPIMLASRVIEGVSHLIIVVAAPTLIAQITAPKHRYMTMTLWSTFFGFSFALVAWLGLPFVEIYGAGNLFLVHSALMAAVAILLYFTLPTGRLVKPETTGFSLRDILARHFRCIARQHWQPRRWGGCFTR